MAYSMHCHISYILEGNCKSLLEIGNKNWKQSKVMLKKLNGLTFFFFFNILLPSLCFQNNNYKRHCLRSMPKVSNRIKFKKKIIC